MPDRINDVRPFRALHYDPAVVGEVGACLSQPYDVITPGRSRKPTTGSARTTSSA